MINRRAISSHKLFTETGETDGKTLTEVYIKAYWTIHLAT